MLAEMRKWVDTVGGGGPFPGAKAPALIPKREALDRLNQHTMICPSCSGVSSSPLRAPEKLSCKTCFTQMSQLPSCMAGNSGLDFVIDIGDCINANG